MSEELKRKIRQFQNYEDCWFHGGDDDFIELGEFLLSKGLSEEDVYYILNRAYSIVSNEFGD